MVHFEVVKLTTIPFRLPEKPMSYYEATEWATNNAVRGSGQVVTEPADYQFKEQVVKVGYQSSEDKPVQWLFAVAPIKSYLERMLEFDLFMGEYPKTGPRV